MPLSGQAKVDYQREYMRRRRSNKWKQKNDELVRPKSEDVRPKEQSYNSMMVGYVPPRD